MEREMISFAVKFAKCAEFRNTFSMVKLFIQPNPVVLHLSFGLLLLESGKTEMKLLRYNFVNN